MTTAPPPLDPVTVRASNLLASGDFDPGSALCKCGQPKAGHEDGPQCPHGYQLDPAFALAVDAYQADQATALSDVAEHARRARAERKTGGWGVGPSDYGRCRRAIQYRERPPDGFVPLPEDTRKADVGTAIHMGFSEARGARYPWRMHGLRVQIRGLDGWAEVDEYDPVTATVEDWKTAGTGAWEMLRNGPFTSHVGQVDLYGLALDDMGYPVNRLRIRYVSRDTGDEETFSWPYDRGKSIQRLASLIEVVTALDAGIDLARDGSGPTTDPICRRCPFRNLCWNIPEAEAAGRSPESYTVLGPDPDDPTIAWAVERLHAANEQLKAASKERDEAKALIDGLPKGEVAGTGLEIYEGAAGGGFDWKGAYQRAVELWNLPAAFRPERLPPPEKRRPIRFTQVRPVRASKTSPQARINTKETSEDGRA